jgi:hypothetical protein
VQASAKKKERMTSTFSFGFSGDDIDEEVTTESGDDHADENHQAGLDSRAGLTSEGERYRLEEWVSLSS